MQLGVQILVDDPSQLEDIRKRCVATHHYLSILFQYRMQGGGDHSGAHPKNPRFRCQRSPYDERDR